MPRQPPQKRIPDVLPAGAEGMCLRPLLFYMHHFMQRTGKTACPETEQERSAGESSLGQAARCGLPNNIMNDLMEQIIQTEYAMLGRVNNLGGPAACQEQWNAFRLMRASQFMTWSGALLESYAQDLEEAEAEGRNLLFEKYAWMMQPALPAEFAKVRHVLPTFSERRIARMEETIAIHKDWDEKFAQRYPAIAGRGRPLYTSQDTPSSTSMETYLRGELSTYSDRTESMYHDFVAACRDLGRNLTTEAREHQVQLEGWPSLEAVEASLQS